MPMENELATVLAKMNAIDWSALQTVYGSAESVPRQLTALFSDDHKVAMKASHDLWCALAHARVWVPEAALAAFPTLCFALEHANEELEVELLEIFWGFAEGNTWVPAWTALTEQPPWRVQLQQALIAYFTHYTVRHPNEETLGVFKWLRESRGLQPRERFDRVNKVFRRPDDAVRTRAYVMPVGIALTRSDGGVWMAREDRFVRIEGGRHFDAMAVDARGVAAFVDRRSVRTLDLLRGTWTDHPLDEELFGAVGLVCTAPGTFVFASAVEEGLRCWQLGPDGGLSSVRIDAEETAGALEFFPATNEVLCTLSEGPGAPMRAWFVRDGLRVEAGPSWLDAHPNAWVVGTQLPNRFLLMTDAYVLRIVEDGRTLAEIPVPEGPPTTRMGNLYARADLRTQLVVSDRAGRLWAFNKAQSKFADRPLLGPGFRPFVADGIHGMENLLVAWSADGTVCAWDC